MISRRQVLAIASLAPVAAVSARGRATGGINVNHFLKDAASRPGGRELQLAVNASAQYGQPAFIPSGCTVVLQDYPAVTLPSDAAIRGEGPSSIITGHFTRNVTNCVLRNDWRSGSKNITLSNFAIDRSGQGMEHGILLNGVAGLTVDHLTVYGATKAVSGILAISGILNRRHTLPRLISRHIIVRDNDLDDCGNFGVQLGHVEGAIVTNSTFRRAFREVIGVEPEACDTAKNVTIAGNTIFALPNLNQGSETGVIVATLTSGGSGITNLLIIGNVIKFAQSSPGKKMPGIGLYGNIDATVTKNYIEGAPGPSIQLGNLFSQQITCVGMTIIAEGRLVGSKVVENKLVSGNMGLNRGGLGSAIYAHGAIGTVIKNNTVSGRLYTSPLFQDAGSRVINKD